MPREKRQRIRYLLLRQQKEDRSYPCKDRIRGLQGYERRNAQINAFALRYFLEYEQIITKTTKCCSHNKIIIQKIAMI